MGTNVRLPKIHRTPPLLPKSISNLQGPQQSLSLGAIPIWHCCAVLPHDKIVCDHSCDERKKSNEPSVCHTLWSILRQLVQVYLQTRGCQCQPVRAKLVFHADLRATCWLLDWSWVRRNQKKRMAKVGISNGSSHAVWKSKKGYHPRSTKRTNDSPFSYADGHLKSQECWV